MSKVIGIDLGTTNSAVAIMEAGQPKILENSEGARTTPSIVAVSKTGERLVGLLAKRQAVTNPKSTIFGIKRFIGHTFDDANVQKDKAIVPFEISKSGTGGVRVKMGDKDFSPEEISSMILAKIKADVEAKIGEKVTQAIITVPAYFNDAQRQATKDAGQIAGLEVLRIINEPTAAALAYGLDKSKQEEKIVVFDFGGGTFDVSVLEVGDSVIEVKSTDGDSHLGGKDIDQKIINFLADEFKKESGIDLRGDTLALQRLDESAEKAKIELSTSKETDVNLPFVTVREGQPLHLVMKLTRAKLESLIGHLVEKTLEPVRAVLKDAKVEVTKVDEVVLVGGMTRMPKVIETVKEFFGKEPNRSVNPDEVVAIGAAVQAGVLTGETKDVVLLDVTPLTLGVETLGSVMTPLITRNTTVPTAKSEVFSTAGDNQTQVEIHVLQGERPLAKDNKSLGRFILDGIPPAPRGVPQVEVTFDLDANGILTVTAKDKATGKSQAIKITGSTGLSKDEIEKMKEEAEKNAETDKKEKEKIESKNKAENLIYVAEKSLKDAGDKAPKDVKEEVEKKIKSLKEALPKGDKEDLEQKTKDLSESLSKVGQNMYKTDKPEKGKPKSEDQKTEDGKKENKTDEKKGKKDVEEGEVVQ